MKKRPREWALAHAMLRGLRGWELGGAVKETERTQLVKNGESIET